MASLLLAGLQHVAMPGSTLPTSAVITCILSLSLSLGLSLAVVEFFLSFFTPALSTSVCYPHTNSQTLIHLPFVCTYAIVCVCVCIRKYFCAVFFGPVAVDLTLTLFIFLPTFFLHTLIVTVAWLSGHSQCFPLALYANFNLRVLLNRRTHIYVHIFYIYVCTYLTYLSAYIKTL